MKIVFIIKIDGYLIRIGNGSLNSICTLVAAGWRGLLHLLCFQFGQWVAEVTVSLAKLHKRIVGSGLQILSDHIAMAIDHLPPSTNFLQFRIESDSLPS